MHSQASKYWNEITTHQFCFGRPQFEIEIIKTLERNDLLRFYDHYISPRSIHRRKIAVHVDPSSLALEIPIKEVNAVENEAELKAMIHGELTSSVSKEHDEPEIAVTTGSTHDVIHLTEQPPIIDKLIETNSKEIEKILSKQEINLSKTEWIDNVHVWKSKLTCYPLAQSYEKLDIPVLCKL